MRRNELISAIAAFDTISVEILEESSLSYLKFIHGYLLGQGE